MSEQFSPLLKETTTGISEVPKLKDLDPVGRSNEVLVCPGGVMGKQPRSLEKTHLTEEQLVREFQDWQRQAVAFLETSAGQDFITKYGLGTDRNYLEEIQNIVYLGERELKIGCKRLADHIEELIREGTQVILVNSRPGGASNEYVLLHVLEELSQRETPKNNVAAVNTRWLQGESIEERVQQIIADSSATKQVLVTVDDWRISGNQIRTESSDLHQLAQKLSVDYPAHVVTSQVGLLFESESREKDGLDIWAAFGGDWAGAHRHILSGVWTLVDYGFWDRKDLLELSAAIGKNIPSAFNIIRPTEVLPSKMTDLPQVYKAEPLRTRALKVFSQWMAPDGLIPEGVRNQIRIFESAQAAQSWEELPIQSLADLEIACAALDAEHPIIRQFSAVVDRKITEQRQNHSINLANYLFDDTVADLVWVVLKEAIEAKGLPNSEITQLLQSLRLVVDAIIRVVQRKREIPLPPVAPKEQYTYHENGKESYFSISLDQLGAEVLNAQQLVIDESVRPNQALVAFDRKQQDVPYEKKNAHPFVSVFGGKVYVFFPPHYQLSAQVAELLSKKGFGEQFSYTWNEEGKDSVYFSPQEYIRYSEENKLE